ncbi:hypothetical protein GCM10022286_24170 [Gryllotalpicola daejeonensis]|uniref:Uncharacterized protein n=1 Tax=Gryllotalpicola daejeonensis TaxID=993087 RepID=A0ABP7ZLU2_9MICO
MIISIVKTVIIAASATPATQIMAMSRTDMDATIVGAVTETAQRRPSLGLVRE